MSHRPPSVRARLAQVVVVLLGVVAFAVAPADRAAAAQVTAGGFTTSARLSASEVARGGSVTITARVTAAANRSALVDVEVYDGAGRRVVQRFWDGQPFTAGTVRNFPVTWNVPAGQSPGAYRIDIGIFEPGWRGLHHWNSGATSVRVTGTTAPPTTAPPTTAPPTTAPPTTAPPTTAPPTTAPPTTAPPTTTAAPPPAGARFETLPPGTPLPSDGECAARVRRAPEIRAVNAGPNSTRGQLQAAPPTGVYGRVTGNFTGTTDEIIQWAACKWGFDEDIIRAQTAKESWWVQRSAGDWTSDASRCAPGRGIGVDGRPGQCPESFGVQQLRYPYWGWAFPSAITSTAFNLDAALAARRSCYEGYETWLNTVERGREYAAGDLWGCIGTWFSGRWYTQPSLDYIAEVQDYLDQRIWTRPEFVSFQG